MYENTQQNPNGYPNEKIEVDKSSQFLRRFFGYTSSSKNVNPIYATFKGGIGMRNEKMTHWDYFCLWGHLRFVYNKIDLMDDWTHISLHGYRNGYTYTPVKKLLWNFMFHFVYRKKWPFIKIGIDKILPLYNPQ